MALVKKQDWDDFLETYPEAHLLQTSLWGDFKSKHGWYAKYLINGDTGAQILFRKLPLNFRIGYIPKGPIGDINDEFISELVKICKKENAFVFYIEPDVWENKNTDYIFNKFGFKKSLMAIQPRRTILLSLEGEEDDWLARMKQKTRYNIRLAKKKELIPVVITHYPPVIDAVKETRLDDPYLSLYTNNLEDLLSTAKVWISGHTHNNYMKYKNNCLLVSNQLGKAKDNITDFSKRKIITI